MPAVPDFGGGLFHDVPAQRPAVPIAVNAVRVSGQKISVRVEDPLFDGVGELLCDVMAEVSLRADQRGVHMSRVEQALLTGPRHATLPGLALLMAEEVRGLQDQDRARVSLRATVPLRTTTPVTGLTSPDTVQVAAWASVGETVRGAAALSATNILACPCMQTYALEDLAAEVGLPFEQARELLGRVPIATHSQKGRLRLEVQAPHPDRLPAYRDLYDVARSATTLTQELLKRPDEYDMVRRAHLNPQFVEDVARTATADLMRALGSLRTEGPEGLLLDVLAESYESIHGHDISAHISTSAV